MDYLNEIAEELRGAVAPRPSGQLSGHAGGLVFEAMAHRKLEEKAPGRAFRHYQALNEALLRQSSKKPDEVRFGEPALHFLVSRGVAAMKKWTPTTQFQEKQNDTAESIVFSDAGRQFDSPHVALIDIKSQNVDKNSQPPNIISANKLFKAAKLVIEGGEEPRFDIFYLGVKFKPVVEGGAKLLKAEDWRAISLFKTDPKFLYINWAAALQVQFHPFEVGQDFKGTRKEWFEGFIADCYAPSLEKRITKLQKQYDEAAKLVTP